MAVPNQNSLKRARVVEETLDSDESEIEPEDVSDSESGDDLVDIKQEIEDWDDYQEDIKVESDDFTEEVEAPEEDEQKTAKEAKNGFLQARENGDAEDNFADVESEDEAQSSERESEMKKKLVNKVRTKKKVRIAVPEDESSESEEENEEEEDDGDDDDDDEGDEKSGLGNVLSKILGTKKKGKEILSKAKKDYDIIEKEEFEVVDDEGRVKKEVKEVKDESMHVNSHTKYLMRKAWMDQFCKKPSLLEDREQERKFKIIATQGVVQLFCAIAKHKAALEEKTSDVKSVVEREMLLEKAEKKSFMKVLQKESKNMNRVLSKKENLKEEPKDEELDDDEPVQKKPRWSALSENFYKEPTLKGWDQESDND